MNRLALAAACSFLSFAAFAQESAPAEDSAAFLASLKPVTGAVVLPGSRAALNLPEGFHYLVPDDAQRLIEQGWGNPPGSGEGTLGMVLPAKVNPLGEAGWGVIITYVDDGHVADDDAASIDYGDLLKDMQASTDAANEERGKAGYESIKLSGWAEPPHYDAASKKIYWAKDLKFGENAEHTLNYCIRVLGREGVLELNAVAGMSQLESVKESMKQVVGFADFTQGNRYADFNAGTDKVAAYGLAALVAGGLAAKTGLFAKLLALLVAMKKFVIIALAAIGGLFAKLFKRKPAGGASPGGANPA
jgi:uncharacterized membrane-anchored protein